MSRRGTEDATGSAWLLSSASGSETRFVLAEVCVALCRLLQLVVLLCRSDRSKELEILLLRHELAILRRQPRRAPTRRSGACRSARAGAASARLDRSPRQKPDTAAHTTVSALHRSDLVGGLITNANTQPDTIDLHNPHNVRRSWARSDFSLLFKLQPSCFSIHARARVPDLIRRRQVDRSKRQTQTARRHRPAPD